jgi:hypothetical protein
MPSALTEPRTARIHPNDLEQLRKLSRERDMTVSALIASFVHAGLRQTTTA